MQTNEQKAPMRDVFLRTVAVLGLVAVLLLGAWGIIQLAVAIPGLFGSIGSSVSSLWSTAKKEAPATTNTSPQTTSPASSNTKTTTASKAGGSTKASVSAYYPANTRAALYGYPDLAVSINSILPNGSREQVSFTIQNVGTNVVPAGWTFNASLPVSGSYTFQSQPQQALYPGGKIVYTLGFDRTYGSYGAYNQYPYNNYNYGYTGSAYYSGLNYYTCNSYGPCFNNNYNYNSYPYNYNYGYQYGGSGIVTITADPQGALYEYNKANNTATAPVY